jgi:hypothetical protein
VAGVRFGKCRMLCRPWRAAVWFVHVCTLSVHVSCCVRALAGRAELQAIPSWHSGGPARAASAHHAPSETLDSHRL